MPPLPKGRGTAEGGGGIHCSCGRPSAIFLKGNILATTKYGELSKWGRLRALPVADEASSKEWQRSKFRECKRAGNFGHRNRT